jgi:dethiobiotin synthetase
MHRTIVAGCGTDVGKTLVTAILAVALQAKAWKPIECGPSDTATLQTLLGPEGVHPPAYRLTAPISPHAAAQREGIIIQPMTPPSGRLIIESVGGVLVPLTIQLHSIDLFAEWDADWVLVSRHYLGSINHTLLTLEAIKRRGLRLRGLIFNGSENLESEEAILYQAQVPLLGRLLPEPHINRNVIKRYAAQWQV